MVQGVVGRFTAVAFNAAQILVVLVTVFFGVIFTLMNPRPIFGAIFLIVPERHHEQTLAILQRVGRFVPTWAIATLLAMLTVGLLVLLLMWPFFGFVDALVLALIAGVFEAVPYLGPILSAVPALLFALGEGGMTPLWVLLAYLAVQVLENNVIAPMIMARSMKLHSVAVIFSMLLCVAAFGVLGVLVAAPLVAIVGIVHDELYRKRFLPTVTDSDLDRLARDALREKQSVSK
jgi:predicted PurR-regulated permease PerM